MKSRRKLSYSLMLAGAVASAQALLERWQWDEVNIHTAIMLDWDDVQAVATRMSTVSGGANNSQNKLEALLRRFKENGATHLSIPELTLNRLLRTGELNVTQGKEANRVYLRAEDAVIADLVTTELQARLPQLLVRRTKAKNPLISFSGDLPTVAEVGLGFDPAHAKLAQKTGLSPVARPVGYSWMQPEMIERTFDQAAALGAKIVAIQGNLIPGHEFQMRTTVEAMRRCRLTYAYFKESRHQKGDWFLAKNLAPEGLLILAHEFEPPELLEEDWFTISYRWANLALEAGIRLCSVRFFKILHAADPLESLEYIRELSKMLQKADLLVDEYAGSIDLTVYQPKRNPKVLAGVGLSIAGAAGLASDLLPVPDPLKIAGLGLTTLALTGLPFLEKTSAEHSHSHPYHQDHGHDHHHEQGHHHPHVHSHNHDRSSFTAYAPKGLALAATVAYPAAALAINGPAPTTSLIHNLAVAAAGGTALTATTAEIDYWMGIKEYRGYNLDWLIPLGLATCYGLLKANGLSSQPAKPKFQLWRWLPVASLGLAVLKNFTGDSTQDLTASIDREHRHAHTHHLSAYQRYWGDFKMALAPRPLRKWTFLAPVGAIAAILFKRNGNDDLAAVALTATAAGQVATLTGFRNGQRPLLKTVEGRTKGWIIGASIAVVLWLMAWLVGKKK